MEKDGHGCLVEFVGRAVLFDMVFDFRHVLRNEIEHERIHSVGKLNIILTIEEALGIHVQKNVADCGS